MTSPPRTLVVDDEAVLREAVVETLIAQGHEVTFATSAEQAIGMLRPLSHDLVLSDLRMPGRGGLHLLAEAKSIDPTLPVILMTGFGDVESSVEALRLAADDFVTKPMRVEELARVCRRALEKGRLLRENLAQKQRLERLYKLKSDFLANMSHELRTPLTTIIGMSEVLTDELFGGLNPKQKHYVETMNQSGRHLLSLINDVLDYSKVEAGQMVLHSGEADLAEILRIACQVTEGQAMRKEIRLILDAVASDVSLTCDQGKVVQVLVNLLSNAVKFSPRGSSIRLAWSIVADEPPMLRIAVSDRGTGIPADRLVGIFDAFQQVHDSASGKDPGTGLGLALSRRLARLHGGDVGVVSELGVGSTFTLALPLRGRPADADPCGQSMGFLAAIVSETVVAVGEPHGERV